MPLSEHEQRLLDQIERALYQEDPKFASTVRATDLRSHMRRRLRRAALVLALGFAILFTGLITLDDPARTAVGVTGFVVMVGALLLAMSAWKRLQPGGADLRAVTSPEQTRPSAGPTRQGRPGKPGKPGRKHPRAGGSGSLKDRLEERWNRRWDERGR